MIKISRRILNINILFILLSCSFCKGQEADSTKYTRIRIDGPNSQRLTWRTSPLFVITAGGRRLQIPEDGNFRDTVAIAALLEYINPKQIQSMDVLKNKDATDKYGSLGQHGVVLINLKRGSLIKLPCKIRRRFKDI